jgi:hypothetical protein
MESKSVFLKENCLTGNLHEACVLEIGAMNLEDHVMHNLKQNNFFLKNCNIIIKKKDQGILRVLNYKLAKNSEHEG